MHPFFLDEEIKEELESKLGLSYQVTVAQDKDIFIKVSTSTQLLIGELCIPFILAAGGYVLDFDYGSGIFLEEDIKKVITKPLGEIIKK